MGDLIAFKGFLNSSTPFSLYEHPAVWRGEQQYHDFKFNNEYNSSCELPRFWGENGLPVVVKMTGCYNRFSEWRSS
jgi:alpha-1,3-glucan synthase